MHRNFNIRSELAQESKREASKGEKMTNRRRFGGILKGESESVRISSMGWRSVAELKIVFRALFGFWLIVGFEIRLCWLARIWTREGLFSYVILIFLHDSLTWFWYFYMILFRIKTRLTLYICERELRENIKNICRNINFF